MPGGAPLLVPAGLRLRLLQLPPGPGSALTASDPWDEVARRHLDRYLSPITDAAASPLSAELDRLAAAGAATAADLGCGAGALLPALLARFERVIAVDGSREMLARARAACAGAGAALPPGLELRRRRLSALAPLAGSIDVAVASNSLIQSDPDDLRRSFRSVARCLVPGGTLLGIFPAIEPLREIYRRAWASEVRRGTDPRHAAGAVRRAMGGRWLDLGLGLVDNGHMLQKHFDRGELERQLVAAGLTVSRFGEVRYPPSIRFADTALHRRRRTPLWHHFVRCEAPRSSAGKRSRRAPANAP